MLAICSCEMCTYAQRTYLPGVIGVASACFFPLCFLWLYVCVCVCVCVSVCVFYVTVLCVYECVYICVCVCVCVYVCGCARTRMGVYVGGCDVWFVC